MADANSLLDIDRDDRVLVNQLATRLAGVMAENTWRFETAQIHAGQEPDAATNARALPIYQTTSYTFDNTDHAAALFGLSEPGNIYTRIMNPTQDAVERRIAALEGGVAALMVSSGQSAATIGLLNIAEAGDHVVSSPLLYGGTYNLLHYTFKKMGIEVTFVDDPDDLGQWESAIRDNTKAFFGETIANPRNHVLDLPGVAEVAHQHGIPLIVDNTVATPYLLNPLTHGADVVLHSATKYLGGHGTSVAGAIVDGGTFDWTGGRHPNLTTPDPSYHGVVFAEMDPAAYITKARVQLLRDLGTAVSPFNAFLIAQGIETLSLRMERHVHNANRVAAYLNQQDQIDDVFYAGLPGSPSYDRAAQLLPKGAGAIVAFELAGGVQAGKAFVNAVKLHSHVANIGDVRSLVIHPASTTHSQLSEAEQRESGVTPGLVRLSVGIEHIDDIIDDLAVGLDAASKL